MTALIMNINGNDTDRKVIGGNTTNLINLNSVKYKWAVKLYKTMRELFWIPEKVDLSGDVTCYQTLTDDERNAFDGMLSYLTFLDSIQTVNLPFIKQKITAPEISLCLSEQISQEAMHNQSYQYIIETVIPKNKRESIYENWRTIPELTKRCLAITRYYQEYVDHPTERNYYKSLYANYLLEGIYFYNGFVFFYNLANRQLMNGCADIFLYINKDEAKHLYLFKKIFDELFKDNLELKESLVDDFHQMTREAVDSEIEWSTYILKNILGMTAQTTEQYTKHLANNRLKDIGLPALYTNTVNPYKHLERVVNDGKNSTTKANFFETTVTSYTQSSALGDWDF